MLVDLANMAILNRLIYIGNVIYFNFISFITDKWLFSKGNLNNEHLINVLNNIWKQTLAPKQLGKC